MHLNPYGEDAVRLALDLVREPPTTAAELTTRSSAAGLVVDRPGTAADLVAVRAFLVDWLAVVDAAEPARRAALLNALLAASAGHPRLTDHAGTGWHLHHREPELSLSGVLRALVSVGTGLHLAGRGMHRLGRCAVAECGTPFADTTRGGRQRYCGTTCANRDAVRRHRARSATPAPR